MIDTSNYDYENIQKWVVSGNTVLSVAPPENRIVATNLTIQDAQLIADAPLLLEEVKRLREELELYKTRYLKMTEGMDWQEENEMWGDE